METRIAGQRTQPGTVDGGMNSEVKTETAVEASSETPAPRGADEAGERSGEKAPEARRAGSLLGNYKAEVAELLGGGAARRRRKGMTAAGLPLPEGDVEESQIKMTRPPRRGRGTEKD
ncbi:hypothetical protein [Winogradskya consettensis]|uniref:hypothetical protein n=1 Tax=Winogradskya consettensis TaxID=113560 RepID=UPI001BB3641B|nr:hypothetical protein [Actinoplanes consettensis]